jgi:hypothetical protein
MIEPTLEQQRAAEAALYTEDQVVVYLSDKDAEDVSDVQVLFLEDEWLSFAQERKTSLGDKIEIVVLSPAQAYALYLSLNARYS